MDSRYRRLRRVMLAGVLLTLIGVVGLATSFAFHPEDRSLPWWFVPFYAVGSLLLIGGGVGWLARVLGKPGSGGGSPAADDR